MQGEILTLQCRVCSCGCSKPLLKADGSPDWSRRRFAGRECLAKDKCNRVASKRAHAAQHPGPRLSIDGTELPGGNLPDLVKALKQLGHDVKIIREKRTPKGN
jgi:hypothetical protein